MIRRIGYAGAGLCAFLLPACVSNWNPTDPYWANVSTGTPVGNYQQSRLPGTNAVAGTAGSTRPINARIADGRFPMVQTSGTGVSDTPVVSFAGQPDELPKDLEKRNDPATAPTEPPKPANAKPKSPANDDVVIRPQWPNLGSATSVETSSSAKAFENLTLDPPADQHILQSRSSSPTPAAPVPPLVPMPVPDVPQPIAAPKYPEPISIRTPVLAPVVKPAVSEPVVAAAAATANETVLIKALRAFQNNRPDEAVQMLRQLDPTNQDVLLYLMPLMVRLGEGNMQTLPPDELAALVDRLQQATAMLKSKAALRLERVCFCSAVRKFGDVVAFEPRHEFRPGDMVHLYLEIRNFTCKTMVENPPTAGKPGTAESFLIKLATRLEILDPQGRPVVYWDLKKDDRANTPPQDYYHTYRFSVPENLPPGTYTLWVTVADKNKPESPGVRQPIELRVGRN